MNSLNKEAELLLHLGLPVWVAHFNRTGLKTSASANCRVTQVTRPTGSRGWDASNFTLVGKKGGLRDNVPMATSIFPDKESAIAHYNDCITKSVDNLQTTVDLIRERLNHIKYKV